MGVHPNEQEGVDPKAAELFNLAKDKKVIAIGETGLDYFRSTGDLGWQHNRFREHIRAAIKCNKPLIIHTREAAEDTLNIMKEEGAEKCGGVMHCFAEDRDVARQALDLGFYISFSGIVTFKSAKELKEVETTNYTPENTKFAVGFSDGSVEIVPFRAGVIELPDVF